MFTEDECRAYAKYLVKREMHKSHTNVTEIAQKLGLGVNMLRTKINRGAFSAGFLFQVLNLLECKNIDLTDIEIYISNLNKKRT